MMIFKNKIFRAAILFTLAIAPASYASTISPEGHQAIKAKVIDETPENFTINVKTLANFGANEEAPTFAVYTASSLPKECGDFSDLSLKYQKPEKYLRVFDLSSNMKVLDAINAHECVVIKNIPSEE